MQSKCLRLLAILKLLENRGPVTIRTIARFLNASQRSVYRDLRDLRSVDIPIRSHGSLYSLDSGWQKRWTLRAVKRQLDRL
jgi:predicted DNA-binding transcriptional regulator YafY